jgi:hypothetical protein
MILDIRKWLSGFIHHVIRLGSPRNPRSAARDLLERYIWPQWLIPQFRYHVENEREPVENREGQQQVLRTTFPGIRDCVRELLKVRTDRLALKFHETKDMAAADEIYLLAEELIKLDESFNPKKQNTHTVFEVMNYL